MNKNLRYIPYYCLITCSVWKNPLVSFYQFLLLCKRAHISLVRTHTVSRYYYWVNSIKDFLHNLNKKRKELLFTIQQLWMCFFRTIENQFLAWGFSSINANLCCPTDEIFFFSNTFKHLFTLKLFTQFTCKKLSLSPSVNMLSLMVSMSVLSCWLLLNNSFICPVVLVPTNKYPGLNDKEHFSNTLPFYLASHWLISGISSSFYFLLNVCSMHRFCCHTKKSVCGSFAPVLQPFFQH